MTDDELFFDTDCISAFLWVKKEDIVLNLFTGKIILPQPVYDELQNPSIPHIKNKVSQLCTDSYMSSQKIELGSEVYNLYHELAISPPDGEVKIGRGEAAAIAMAKVYNGTIASNNLKDVAKYVEKYNLKHITTGDILLKALGEGLITESEGNTIWTNMINKKRILPTSTFSQYIIKYGE